MSGGSMRRGKSLRFGPSRRQSPGLRPVGRTLLPGRRPLAAMGALRNAREELPGVVAVLVLGLGLADLFLNVVPGIPFWVIFIIGFAVVLPLVGILFDEDDEYATGVEPSADRNREGEQEDPLERLKRWYAEGEIGDEEFERRLERLLETEDESRAADYLRRERSTGESPAREREEA